jgi:sporulation protein YlmC with PRC-barrel domain
MKPEGAIKLVSQLIDLPIVDKDDRSCGIVDDIEFEGGVGKALRLKNLLVGPGAYSGRMPAWSMWVVRMLAGDRITRVPLNEIAEIGAVVKLKCEAKKLGLHRTEDRVRSWIPRAGAM